MRDQKWIIRPWKWNKTVPISQRPLLDPFHFAQIPFDTQPGKSRYKPPLITPPNLVCPTYKNSTDSYTVTGASMCLSVPF